MYYLIEFCRLCLSLKGEFTNMCVEDIMEKVTACISELEFESNLPLLVCSKCLEKIEDFFEFRNQCLQSEFFINGYVDKLINDSQSCKKFISTVLKVDIIQSFGSSVKYKGNVRLHKGVGPADDACANKCNIFLRDSLKPWQISATSTDTNSEIHDSAFTESTDIAEIKPQPATENSTIKSEFPTEPLMPKTESIPNLDGVIVNVDTDDDVFIEEEDENSCLGPPELVNEAQADPKIDIEHQTMPVLDNVHDPENLLVDNGHERIVIDPQTDLSERVKLRKRRVQAKPVYFDSDEPDKPKRGLAKKSTTGGKIKKSTSKSNKADAYIFDGQDSELDELTDFKENRVQARKSTTKSSSLKKMKPKISSASRGLWKAACRNWALQRMQTSGHVNTGARSPLITRAELDSIKNSKDHPSSPTLEQNAVQDIWSLSNSIQIRCDKDNTPDFNTDTVNISTTDCQDYNSPTDNTPIAPDLIKKEDQTLNDITSTKPIRSPRIKTVQELNHLLEQQHKRFSKNLSSEYGIIINKESFSGLTVESKQNPNGVGMPEAYSAEQFKTPQIVNTFSLTDEDNWAFSENDSRHQIVFENKGPFSLLNDINITERNGTNQHIIISSPFPATAQTQPNIQPQIIYDHPVESPLETHIVINTNPFKPTVKTNVSSIRVKNTARKSIATTNSKSESVKTLEQSTKSATQPASDTSSTDFEGSITAHYIESASPQKGKKRTRAVPGSGSTRTPKKSPKRTQTKYKIQTTNNIILIDGNQLPPQTLPKEDKLYESNFGNLLQHYLTQSTDPTPTKNLSYRLSPVKLITHKPVSTYPGTKKIKKTNSKTSNFVYNVREKWTALTDPLAITPADPLSNNDVNMPIPPMARLLPKEPNVLPRLAPLSCPPSIRIFSKPYRTKSRGKPTNVDRILAADLKTGNTNSEVILIDDSPPPSNSFNCIAEEEASSNILLPGVECNISRDLGQLENDTCPASKSPPAEQSNPTPFVNEPRDESKSPPAEQDNPKPSVNEPTDQSKSPPAEQDNPTSSVNEPADDDSVMSKLTDQSSVAISNESVISSTPVPLHGIKRPSICDEVSSTQKSKRSSSEESDTLVIDTSPVRSKTPEQFDEVIIKEECADTVLPYLEKLTRDKIQISSSIPKKKFKSIKIIEVVPPEITRGVQAVTNCNGTSPSSVVSLQNDDTPLLSEKCTPATVNISKLPPENKTLNGADDIVSSQSVKSCIPELSLDFKAIEDSVAAFHSPTSDVLTPRLLRKDSDITFDSDSCDKSYQNLDDLIRDLDSPPPSSHVNSFSSPRRRSKRLLKSRSVLKDKSTSPAESPSAANALTKHTDSPKTDFQHYEDLESFCREKVGASASPNAYNKQFVDSENTSTASQHMLASLFQTSPDMSISSDSDSSYVDVEAFSEDEQSSLTMNLLASLSDSVQNEKCVQEKQRRAQLNKHLKNLYDEVRIDHSTGSNLTSVLESARKCIHRLQVKFDTLENKYCYLKTQETYLTKSLARLKKK